MRNPSRWFLSAVAVLLFASPVLAAGKCPPKSGPELLLPAESTVTVAVSSLQELESDWARLAAALAVEDGTDLRSLLLEDAPALARVLDPARGQAASFRIFPVMFQQETAWTYVLPLLDDAVDPATLIDPDDVASWTVRDGYLALSNRPELETVAAAPDWWDDMLPGAVAAHMDLGALIEENRGMVEMSLSALPMQAEQMRQQAEAMGDEAPDVAMPSADQMEGIASLARLVMDSLTALDAAADVAGDDVILRTRFDVQPGSIMAAGPQPAFADALELTRRLPRHADMVAVSAFDQSRTLDAMKGFYRASLKETYGELIRDPEALEAWLDGYEELVRSSNWPWATTLSGEGDDFAMRYVIRADDPAGHLRTLLGMVDMLPALGLGRVEELPDERVGPVTVHVRRVAYDFAGLAATEGLTGKDAAELERLENVMAAFAGEVRLAVQDGLVLVASGLEAEAMTAMIRGGGRPHDRIAALAVRAGPDVRQVVTGDYGMFLDLMAEILGEEASGASIPFTSTATAAGPRGAWDVATTLEGLSDLVAFMEAMDAAH